LISLLLLRLPSLVLIECANHITHRERERRGMETGSERREGESEGEGGSERERDRGRQSRQRETDGEDELNLIFFSAAVTLRLCPDGKYLAVAYTFGTEAYLVRLSDRKIIYHTSR
jgi:hypothetical protein